MARRFRTATILFVSIANNENLKLGLFGKFLKSVNYDRQRHQNYNEVIR